MQEQIAKLSAMVDKAYGTNLSAAMQTEQQTEGVMPQSVDTDMPEMQTDQLGGDTTGINIIDKAKRRAAESTQPK